MEANTSEYDPVERSTLQYRDLSIHKTSADHVEQIFDDTRQDEKAVFRTPNNVVITLPNYMTSLLLFTHFAKSSNLSIAQKNITTTKCGGFLN